MSEGRPDGTLRLCSYNVRKAVGLDWRRRPERCLDALVAVAPDIALLQEADRRLEPRRAAIAPETIRERTGLAALPVAANDVSLGWHGNAVLAREGIELRGVERIVLPGIEPRGAVLLRLEADGRPLAVVATHLGLRRACRRLQLALIVERLEAAGVPGLIAGDFNEWREDRDRLDLPERYEVVAPGYSFHAARPVARLDRFVLSPGLRATASGVERGPAARMASDHLPVWLELAPAPSEAGRAPVA